MGAMSSFLTSAVTLAAEEAHEVDHTLSWAVGIGTLVLLLALLGALVAFGGGREHS